MDTIRVRDKRTGLTGTMPRENFNPQKYEVITPTPTPNIQPPVGQPNTGAASASANYLIKQIPTISGIGADVGMSLSGAGKLAGRLNPAITGLIYGASNVIPDVIKSMDPSTAGFEYGGGYFNPMNKGASEISGFTGSKLGDRYMSGFLTGSGADLLSNLISQRIIMGPVLSKMSLWKSLPRGLTREGITGGLEKEASRVASESGKKIGSALDNLGDVDIKSALQKIYEKNLDVRKLRGPTSDATVKEINKKITNEIAPNIGLPDAPLDGNVASTYIPASNANRIKTMFNNQIFGEAGTELKKRGDTGIKVKETMKMTADELNNIIKKALKERGYANVLPEYNTFSEASKLAASMEDGLQSEWGYLPALIGFGGGGILSGGDVGIASTLAMAAQLGSTPYLRALALMALGRGTQGLGWLSKAGITGYGNTQE